MSASTLTDIQIQELLRCPKRVANPSSRKQTDGKHVRQDFKIVSVDGKHEFVLFSRQSTVIKNGFSVGLRWRARSGEEVILLRCNGADHHHANSLERQRFEPGFHVHRATERYIIAGRKPEGYAEPTTAYCSITGALHELFQRANISGMKTEPDHPDMFG